MHNQYLPTDKETKLKHIIEECSEVILAYMKMERFGPESCDPTVPPENQITNREALLLELKDLESALVRYRLHGFTLNTPNPEDIF